MAKRGRPKKDNAIRKPCGESTGDEIQPPPYSMAGIAEKEVVHEGKILQLRKRVTEIERLYDEGKLREHQRIAGERYANLVRLYRAHILADLGAPKDEAKVARLERLSKANETDFELLDAERQKELLEFNESLIRRYDAMWLLLVDRPNGISIKRGMDNLCLRDDSNSLNAARVGLDLLAEYFGLETRKRG